MSRIAYATGSGDPFIPEDPREIHWLAEMLHRPIPFTTGVILID